jgi:hypothetical protein
VPLLRRRNTVMLLVGNSNMNSDSYGIPFWNKAQVELIKELGEDRWASLLEGISDLVALTQFFARICAYTRY